MTLNLRALRALAEATTPGTWESRTAIPALLDMIESLQTRQQELLATIVRLTNEVPFPDEMEGWTATRAAMVAEIGTLRSQVADLQRELLASGRTPK